MPERDGERQQPGGTAKPPRSPRRSLVVQTEELRKNLRRPLASTRVALRQEITLHFPHFQSFLTQCSANLSMTGMFIRSETPAPPGTLVDFEILLVDGLRLIHGRAEVVWVRETREEPDRPPGMGLRFLRLDAESRRMIRWLVERHFSEKGWLVDFKDLQRDPRYGEGGRDLDLRELYPYAGVATARPPKSRLQKTGLRRRGFYAAATLVALLAGGFLLRSSDRLVPQEVSLTPALASAAQMAPTEDVRGPASAQEGLFETLEAWARENSGGHYDEYLDLPRLWETSVESPPSSLKLETSFEARFLGPDRVEVTFLHRYLSEDGEDTVRTTLDLALEDGRWRILEEATQERTTAAGVEDSVPVDGGFVRQAGRIEVLSQLSLRQGQPSTSAPKVRMLPPGTVLDYAGWTTRGEAVNGNDHWYQDLDGNYFWAGGTSAPAPVARPSSTRHWHRQHTIVAVPDDW